MNQFNKDEFEKAIKEMLDGFICGRLRGSLPEGIKVVLSKTPMPSSQTGAVTPTFLDHLQFTREALEKREPILPEVQSAFLLGVYQLVHENLKLKERLDEFVKDKIKASFDSFSIAGARR